MNYSKKIAYNTIVQFAGRTVSIAIGLGATAIMTRYLGSGGFGEYTTVFAFLSFFGIVADFGFTLIATQMLSEPGNDRKKTLDTLFTLRLVSGLILLILIAPAVAFFVPYSAAVKTGIFLASFSFLFTLLNQIFVGIFQKELKTDRIAAAEIASRLTLLASVALAAKGGFGLGGIIFSNVAANGISFILHYLFSKKFARISLKPDKETAKIIFAKSWPLAITIFLNLIYLKADTLILSLIKNKETVGLYGAAYKVIDVLVMLPFLFCGVILPALTESFRSGDQERFGRLMQKSFDLLAIIAWPMVIGSFFAGEKTMTLIAGGEFTAAGAPLKILSLAAGVIFLGTLFSHAVIAIDRQKKTIPAYLFTAVTALAAYLVFIPRYSYYGAAWATVYSELAIALFSFYYVRKYSRFAPKLGIFFRASLASLLMGAFLDWTKIDSLILLVLFGAIFYFAALFAIGGIRKEEIMIIIKKEIDL